ncbi:WD domain, G-beta repeat protein (macronuclear) [Tetrahymena thermophila SB210]|uniref:WD domain, G-beta repeat protein n=1 Tax=Tetrahymena thermophila (strain SB210) TaxID=312017 RepID=Q237P2_TETTS|nr:WD domain, G-beta repeat protein [Tetrahymena thermophila SB210]EAR92699.3 WD domain, G-beta repeat protein [Tetrahymena thermophila SB210]|eukprot:XP_001012944.3 WD domain, G-beta repeat protein [Tetrahymena thermophila SB210]
MDSLYTLTIFTLLFKLSLQQICPFDFNLGYTSRNCQGMVTENVIFGGELFYFKYQDQFINLMVDYGSSGLFGVWNLTDASLLYTTNFYQDNNIEFHSIYVDKHVGIFDKTISQSFVYILDKNLNVYQQSLYQQQGKLILTGSPIANNFPLSVKVCYNIKTNVLFYPQNNQVYQRKNNLDYSVEIDSDGVQCESDFNQEYIFILSAQNQIYMINQNSFQIEQKFKFDYGNIIYLRFDINQGLTFLMALFYNPNQINDYGFQKDNTLIACGVNSLITFDNQIINPSTTGIDTTDYDYKNIQPSLDLNQLNYTNLIIGDDYTVFFGSSQIITVVVNKNRVVQLNKYIISQLLVGLKPNAIIEGSLLKTLSSSGLLFIEISNGQIKKHTSCFKHLDVYEEKIVALYFDDELLRIYALENQGKLGYFSYPKGEYLTQYYNLSQNSAGVYNKQKDQIYIWGTQGPSNFVVVTSYIDGTFLSKLQFNDQFIVNNVYYNNNIDIIIVVDPSQKISIFSSQKFSLLYEQDIYNNQIQIFLNQQGAIFVFQSTIQLLTKNQANGQISTIDLNINQFIFQQTYLDIISNSLIMAKADETIQILSINSQYNTVSKNLQTSLKNNQITQNICFGEQYIVILMNYPNQIVIVNKLTNEENIINNLTMMPNQCLLLLNEKLLLIISNVSDLLFINMSSLNIIKTDVLDELSSVSKIEIDIQQNLLIILLSSSKIISYDIINLKQVCDWTPFNSINVSTFQINIKYKMIVYGSGLQMFFTDYSQKKLINQIKITEGAQGGVVDYQTNSLFVFTNKIYQYDLQTNNLLQASQSQHDNIITQMTIIYEWNIIITSSFDNTLAIWSYPQLQLQQRLYQDPLDCGKVNNFEIELQRNRIFSGCEHGSIYIWKKYQLNNTFYLGNNLKHILSSWNVTTIIVDYQNDYLFLVGWNWYPLILQLNTIEQSVNAIAQLKGINAVYDKLNQCIILYEQDGNVWNYNITSRSYIFNQQNAIHQGWVRSVVIDPQNQMFASMGDDCTIQIWPYNSQLSQIPYYLFKNTAKIQDGKLDLDNQVLIIQDANFRIILLQYPLLYMLKIFDSHVAKINSFIINKNQFQILSFSNDKTVMLWEYELGIEQSYFQIVHRSTSIMSYVYDEEESSVYYVRSEGNVQKWQITSEQTDNGFNLQYNDRFNNTIFMMNNEVFILATTKQLKLIKKSSLQVLQSIRTQCSHSVNKQNIIICGYNNQLISYQLIKSNSLEFQIQQLYTQNLELPLYKLQNGIQDSTELIVILVNHSIFFIESSTGIKTKQFPKIHQQVIVDLIIFNQQTMFSYSYDGQLVQYSLLQTQIQIDRQIQLDYPILQVIINSDYILVNQKIYNYCLIYKNDNQKIFKQLALLQTASRWQTNQQFILSPENQTILVSSDFYYISYDYQSFKMQYIYQSSSLVEANFMKRKVTLIQGNQFFIQQGQSFIIIASSDPSQQNMRVVQKIQNRNSFYENIKINVNKISGQYIVNVLSFNLQGFNHLMTDTLGQMSCQQNMQDSNFFDIYKRIRDYLNLRNNLQIDNNLSMPHLFNLAMSQPFTFYGFPQINSKFQMSVQLTVQGTNQQNQIRGNFYMNQLLSSQNLVVIQLKNLIIELKDQDQQNQIDNQTLQQVQFISKVGDNSLEISKSIINQNKYLAPGSYMIKTNSSNILLQATDIKNQISNSQVSLITLISQNISMNYFSIQGTQSQNQSPVTINQSQVFIDQSYFSSNSLFETQSGGGVFYFTSSSVNISNSIFSQNSAQNGGCIYFIDECKGLIQNVTFNDNIARQNGGVLLLDNSDAQIKKSSFLNNKALIGGVARYLTFKPQFLQKGQSNDFLDSCGTIFQNICTQNQGQLYGNNFCSYPQSAKINNQTIQNNGTYTFYNVQSGTQSQILEIQLLDEEGNIVKMQSSEKDQQAIIQEFQYYQVELKELYQIKQLQDISKRNLKLDGTTLKQFQTNKFQLNQYSSTGQLGNKGEGVLFFYGFNLLSNQSLRFTDTLTIYIDFMFRECQIGEIIQPACTQCSLANCQTCQNGTYSIIDPKIQLNNLQCKPCDYQSSNYCEGSYISLKKGFWRINQYDDQILPCSKSRNLCNGQEETNYCSEGLIGPLCQTCDYLGQFWNSSYGTNSLGDNCFKCHTDADLIMQQILLALVTILYLTYIFYETKVNLNLMVKTLILDKLGLIRLGTSAQIGEKSFYSRIMIRYLQIFLSISTLSPKPIFNVQIISIISPVSSNQNLLDCMLAKFKNDIPIYYYKVLFFVIIPFLIIPLGFLIYTLILKILRCFVHQTKISFYNEFQKDSSIVCFIFLFFFLQQSSFQSLIQPFTCKQVGRQYLVSFYLLEQCYSRQHIFLIVAVILPAVFLWIILIPGILMWKIWTNSKQNNNFSNEFYLTKKYGFLFYGYKRNFYLWEFLAMNLRLILVFFVQYFDENILCRASLMLVFLYLYLLLLQKYQPYQKVNYFHIDMLFSQICCLLTIINILMNVIDSDIFLYCGQVIAYILQLIVFMRILLMYLNAQVKLSYHGLKQSKLIKCFKIILKKELMKILGIETFLKKYLYYFYLLIYHDEDNSFKKFNNFQLLRLWVKDYIEKRKIIGQNSEQENLLKEDQPQSNSLRKTLLYSRAPKNYFQSQSTSQRENKPKIFSFHKHKKLNLAIPEVVNTSIILNINSPNQNKLKQKMSQKLLQMQQSDFESQITESQTENNKQESINNQNFYYFKTKNNSKNGTIINFLEYNQTNKNDMDLELLSPDQQNTQRSLFPEIKDQICPFDFNLGYQIENCQSYILTDSVLGGQLFYLGQQNEQYQLMVNYGQKGMIGAWNLDDASLLFSSSFYSQNYIDIHSIFILQNQSLDYQTSSQQQYIYVVDTNLNVYEQSIYQQQADLILLSPSKMLTYPLGTKVYYNIEQNVLFFVLQNQVYKRMQKLELKLDLNSVGIQCESDLIGEYIFVLTSLNTIYLIDQEKFQIVKQYNFKIGKINLLYFNQNMGLTFQSQNLDQKYYIYQINSDFLDVKQLFSNQNQINDYDFFEDKSIAVCGNQSLIYLISDVINPSTASLNTNDYNLQDGQNMNNISYTQLIIDQNFTIFYSKYLITIIQNSNRVIVLNKCIYDHFKINQMSALVDGFTLKTLSSSGLYFLDIKSGQIIKDTSCFSHQDVYQELINNIYFDDELFRIYVIENKGRLGYFSFPQGSFLKLIYYLKQSSNMVVNKQSNQIYLWGNTNFNYLVVISYYEGTFLYQFNMPSNYHIGQVYYDNSLSIIVIVDNTKGIYILDQKTYQQIQLLQVNTAQVNIYFSFKGMIIVLSDKSYLFSKNSDGISYNLSIQNANNYLQQYIFFDSNSQYLLLVMNNLSIQIFDFSGSSKFQGKIVSSLIKGQEIQNICYSNQYLIILTSSPNSILIYNKNTDEILHLDNLTEILSSCYLILNEKYVTVLYTISQFIIIEISTQTIKKNQIFDNLSSIISVQIDQQKNLFIFLLNNSRIISYDYLKYEQVSDWVASLAPRVTTFQINTKYNVIIYGAGLQIYIIDYSQTNYMSQIVDNDKVLGGVINYENQSLYTFNKKIQQYDLSTNTLINTSNFQHDDIISKLQIIEEWDMMITSSFDYTIIIWSYPQMQFLQRLNHSSITCKNVTNFEVEIGRNRILSGCSKGTLYVWRKQNNGTFTLSVELDQIAGIYKITQIILDVENDFLFLMTYSWHSPMIQLSTIENIPNIFNQLNGINGYYDQINKCIVVSDQNGNVLNYNVTLSIYVFNIGYNIHQGWVRSVVLDPVNQRFASMGDDCTVQIWPYISDDIQAPLFEFQNKAKIQSGLLDYILSFSNDKRIIFWDYELAIAQTYSQIIYRSTSLTSQSYDKESNTVYYARSLGQVQKWQINNKSPDNGFMLRTDDCFNNTIYLVNNDIVLLATTNKVVVINKQSLAIEDSKQVFCSYNLYINYLIICGYHNQLNTFRIVKNQINNNQYQLQQIYSQLSALPIVKFYQGFPNSNEFLAIFQNNIIAFIDITSGKITKQFPQVHSQLIIDLILCDKKLYSYSVDGKIAQYQLNISGISIQKTIQQSNQILTISLNSEYIIVVIKQNNYCIVYQNDDQSQFKMIQQLLTPSRWQSNLQIILSPENGCILLSSNFYYILYDYKTFEKISVFQTNSIVENNFFMRKVTVIQKNQIFVQQGQSFFVLGQKDTNSQNMIISQKFKNRNQFFANIDLQFTKVNGLNVINVISYNLQGINYMMADVTGVLSCQQDLNDTNFFDIQKTIGNYLNLRSSMTVNNQIQGNHQFNLFMSEAFTFYGFPQINLNLDILIDLNIYGVKNDQQVVGSFFFNSVKTSKNLLSVSIINIYMYFENEENLLDYTQGTLQQLQILKCEVNILNPPLFLKYLKLFRIQQLQIQSQIMKEQFKVFEVQNTQQFELVDSNFIKNQVNSENVISFDNSLYQSQNSTFILRNCTIRNNNFTNSSFFQAILISNLIIENNQIENNYCEQSSYLVNSVVSQSISIKGLTFQQNTNLALMNCEIKLKYNNNLLENTVTAKYTSVNIFLSTINSNFYNDESSYLIDFNATQIQLYDLMIYNETSISQSSLISIVSQNLTFKNVTFSKNQCKFKSLISLTQCQAFINSSKFVQNSLLSQILGGGVFYLSSSNISVQDTIFDSNEAQNGGSLYLDYNSNGNLSNSTFQNNKARENGGVALLNNSDIFFSKCFFVKNKALIGGVLRYFTFKPQFLIESKHFDEFDSCNTNFNNFCQENSGQIFGNNFCSYPKFVSVNDKKLQNQMEYDFHNIQSGSQNEKIIINLYDEEWSKVQLKHALDIPQRTQQEFDGYFVNLMELYQKQNNQNIDLIKRDIKLDGVTLKQFQGDSFTLNQYQVTGQLGKQGKAVFTIQGFLLYNDTNKGFTDQLVIYLNYHFRKCQIGEILQPVCLNCTLVNCLECENGTYSIVDPNTQSNVQCLPCNYESSISCRGSQIILRQGYWRESKSDDNIIPCDQSENLCNGNEQTNYCSEGLIGPLCQTCDTLGTFWNDSYGRVSFGISCVKCKTNILKIIPQIILSLVFILYLSYLFYLTKVNLNLMLQNLILQKCGLIRLGITGDIGEKSFYNRILIRYLQIFIIIGSINQNDTFYNVIISLISPVRSNQNSFDCMFKRLPISIPIYYYKSIGLIFIPFIIFPLIFIMYQIIIKIIRYYTKTSAYSFDIEYKKDSLITCLNFLFFFIQQSAFESLIQPLACKQIQQKSYINFYLLEECYSRKHSLLIIAIILPFLVLWVLLIPGILMWKIWKRSKIIGQFSNEFYLTRQYGFFFCGCKRDSYLWEFIPMYLRLILAFFVVYFQEAIITRAVLILISLQIYSIFVQKKKPYQRLQHLKIDIFCSQACSMITTISILLYNTDEYIIQYSGQVVVHTLQFLVIFQIIKQYIEVLIRLNFHQLKIKKCLKFIKFILQRQSCFFIYIKKYIKNTTPSLYLLIYQANHNPFNKFNHFQLLRLHIHNYIERKKKDANTPFFRNIQDYDCKISKEDVSSYANNGKQTQQSPSLRRILLSQRFQNINISETNSFIQPEQSQDSSQSRKKNKSKTFNGSNLINFDNNFHKLKKKKSNLAVKFYQDATSNHLGDTVNSLEISLPQNKLFQQNYEFITKSNTKNITNDMDSSKLKPNLIDFSKQSYQLSIESPNNKTDSDSHQDKVLLTFKENELTNLVKENL